MATALSNPGVQTPATGGLMPAAARAPDGAAGDKAAGGPFVGGRPVAPYAALAAASRGRLHPEPDCPMRSPFQRDRDRILHSSAFRRLTYKTQVFLFHEGDHFRTRLTHSLEVAQVARSMSRLLGLDEDLAEAVALAHDLGHPPFGHAGERALAQVMAPHGGFDHNAQSLRIVAGLERKYAAFDGLNLAWETLEGLVKHNGPLAGGRKTGSDPTGIVTAYDRRHDLALGTFASAEAQAAALADDIAYNNHDIEDGLRAGLIALEDLRELGLTGRFLAAVELAYGTLEEPRIVYEVGRRMITAMIGDAVGETWTRLGALGARSADDVRGADRPAVAFSATMGAEMAELRSFLFASVYRHPRVMRVMGAAEDIVRDLACRYLARPDELPGPWREAARRAGDPGPARLVCDFVAGMTDRFAIEEHRRSFERTPDLR